MGGIKWLRSKYNPIGKEYGEDGPVLTSGAVLAGLT